MTTLSREEWRGYPTIYTLLGDLEQLHSEVAARHQEIMAAVANPLNAGVPGVAQSLRQLISLSEQIEALMCAADDDDSVDVSKWLVYMADMDGYLRRLWVLPAMYGTAVNFGALGTVPSDELQVTADDTWNRIEASTGMPWQLIAQQNRIGGDEEGQPAWTGRRLLVPKTARFGGPTVPGVVGPQSGAAVLGKDFSNALTTQNVLKVSDFSTKLSETVTASATGNVYVYDIGTADTGMSTSGGYLQIENEILHYSAVGTDAEGDYVTVDRRGAEGTVAAAHGEGEVVHYYPQVFELDALPYTDTFIQGCGNALYAQDVQHIFGSDYGAVKNGILLVTILNAIKRDPRVGNISNVIVRTAVDGLKVTMDISSVGGLTTYTLNQHYSGNP